MLFICLTSANETRFVPDSNILDTCLSRIASGDSDALGQLYELTKPAVYSFALSILKNAHEAEDILHDCYVCIYSNAANYTSSGKPMAWIMMITKNLCYMRFREQKKTTSIPEEDWERYTASHAQMSHEDSVILNECMKLLSEEERSIVVLHAVAGMKHREIAQITGLALPTVLSKYRRALSKLRKILTDSNGDTETKGGK